MPLSKSFDVSNIFICWDQLLNIHESKLEVISSSSLTDKSVILSLFSDLLNISTNLYINFCSRQTESTKNFEAKLMSDMRFRQLVNECHRNLHKTIERSQDLISSSPTLDNSLATATSSSVNNWYKRTLGNAKLPLTNFIIKPMQRITKYSLLFAKILETIIKLPDQGHILGPATEVKSAAVKLCEQVNEACRRKEDTEQNKRRLAWAQSHIKQSLNHDSSLDLAGFAAAVEEQQALTDGRLSETIIFDSDTNCLGARQLTKSGCVSKLRSGRELVLFLFNDILLLTQVRGGSILKVDDIFRSTKAQQTYYKFYRAPVLLENLTLVSLSKNRRASWVEKQSITVSFSDQSSGAFYELLALNAAEKAQWIQELGRASEEARNARAIHEERNSLRSLKKLGISDCWGRFFVTVLEASMSCFTLHDNTVDSFSETSSLTIYSKQAQTTAQPAIGPLVSVQIQLRKKDTVGLLETRQENIPISDAFRTSPRQFNLSHKFLSTPIDDERQPKSDYSIEYEDLECTQFLIPRSAMISSDSIDILDIILMNVSNYSPDRVIARRRVRLDSLIGQPNQSTKSSRSPTELTANQRLRSDRPMDYVIKLKPVDLSAADRPCRTSFLERSSSSSPHNVAKQHRIIQEDPSFEIKLRVHLQLFCDQDNKEHDNLLI